jgi:hypothetical protein
VFPDQPRHTLSAADVAELGLDGIEGGVQGIVLVDAGGERYGFALRPLLPDEEL